MKKAFISSIAALSCLALAACDENGGNWAWDYTVDNPGDTSTPDITTEPSSDPATETTPDISTEPVPDSSGGCTNNLGTFTPTEVLAGDFTADSLWTVRAPLSGGFTSPLSMVDIEVNHGAGGPTTPTTVNITSFEGIGTCTTCIILVENCVSSFSDCSAYYMAERATFTITEIGITPGSRLRATLSDAVLASWEPSSDTAIPSGPKYCIDVWNIDVTMTDPTTW